MLRIYCNRVSHFKIFSVFGLDVRIALWFSAVFVFCTLPVWVALHHWHHPPQRRWKLLESAPGGEEGRAGRAAEGVHQRVEEAARQGGGGAEAAEGKAGTFMWFLRSLLWDRTKSHCWQFQAKRKEIRAEQEKKLAQQKKEEEERLRKEEAEKKAKEAEEKRKRLEEAEKKRQMMMQAQKDKQAGGGGGEAGSKRLVGGVRTVQSTDTCNISLYRWATWRRQGKKWQKPGNNSRRRRKYLWVLE